MKGLTKAITISTLVLGLGACSSMNTLEVRETKANPNWYEECEQIGSEGFLFWKDKYAYACGMGESRYEQASEAQAYALCCYTAGLLQDVQMAVSEALCQET